MTRYVGAVVTIVGGRIKAKADPRISVTSSNASLELAVVMAAARQERRDLAGIEMVKRAGREAWRIHQQRGEDRDA